MVSVLFLGKKDDRRVAAAAEYLRGTELECRFGEWGDPLPEDLAFWQGDYIVSYLSRWIVPAAVLKRARVAAINFHPAPPEYPGVGCTNFALYDGAEEYGVTCHHMAEKVDSGRIIATRRFPIFDWDSVETLLERSHDHLLALYYSVADMIRAGEPLPMSHERWSNRVGTRKALNELSRIAADMTDDEVLRRIRATTFRGWRPHIEIAGRRFVLADEEHASGRLTPIAREGSPARSN